MKLVFVTFAVYLVICKAELSPEQKQRIGKYREECISETKVDPELVEKADRGEFADDKNLKCFAKCFYRKVGFINDEAELQLDVIKSRIPESSDKKRAMEVVEKCKDIKGGDPCETAFLIHKCYFENTRRNVSEKKTGE